MIDIKYIFIGQAEKLLDLNNKMNEEKMQIEKELISLVITRFSKAFDRILHVINQLNDEEIWFRPSNNSNSIGIILQHLEGNLNQWVYSALRNEVSHRNRPQEFIESERTSKKDLSTRINSLQKKINETISQLPPDSLLSYRRIQGFDETIMSALISALTHLELHSGQIVYISKLLLGDKYIETWRPANTEQGKSPDS